MKNILTGAETDRMPDWSFRIMSFLFNVTDILKSPAKRLDGFNIRQGQTVVDYGSGTGRFLRQASALAGETGKVYAVDIHPLAVEAAEGILKRYGLKNVHPVLTDGKTVDIPAKAADVIYALDMFHMVKDPRVFLKELHRITKPDGILYLEDGHQPRALSKEKITKSEIGRAHV